MSADNKSGLTFRAGEKSRKGLVRVQIKMVGDALKYRKWNYAKKCWGKWAAYL